MEHHSAAAPDQCSSTQSDEEDQDVRQEEGMERTGTGSVPASPPAGQAPHAVIPRRISIFTLPAASRAP